MPSNVYATEQDVYDYGLPRGTLGALSRYVATVDTSTFELDGHGFETNAPVQFSADAGGSLPTPIAERVTYYAIRISDSTFQVATTVDGSALTLSSEGANVRVATPLPFDKILEYYSRWVDTSLPAHAVPLRKTDGAYPVIIVGIVAELAAKKLQMLAGHTSVSVGEFEVAALAQLARFATGIPIRDPAQVATNTAVVHTISTSGGRDPRGWGSGCLP